jgi:hypothetical protein
MHTCSFKKTWMEIRDMLQSTHYKQPCKNQIWVTMTNCITLQYSELWYEAITMHRSVIPLAHCFRNYALHYLFCLITHS